MLFFRTPVVLLFLLSLAVGWYACKPEDVSFPAGTAVSMADMLEGATEIPFQVNPSGIAPLTALSSFKTRVLCKATVEVLGSEPITHDFEEYSNSFDLPILGLFPGQINEVVLTLTTQNGAYAKDTLRIETVPLPSDFPEITIEQFQPAAMEPGFHFAELSLGAGDRYRSMPILFDHTGTIRWWLELDAFSGLCWPVQRLQNGNLLFARNHLWYEYNMLGQKINDWKLQDYYIYHDIIEMPDGNFLAVSDKVGVEIVAGTGETVPSKADHIILVDRNTGVVLREWDIAQLLDVDRYEILSTQEDWLDMNAIWYDDTDQSIVLSGRNQGMAKVSWENELIWILAPHKGWGLSGRSGDGPPTAPFLLTAVDAAGTPYSTEVQDGVVSHPDFDWPWAQHAPEILSNGNIFVFDNGFKRNFGAGSNYSRGVEYKIDESAGTIQQVWQFGAERGNAFYASVISDVDFLPQTGNRLISPGIVWEGNEAYSKIVEVDPLTDALVFEATLHFKNQGGNGTATWWNMDISYRAGRLTPYPE
ncbi:MAG: aryl-sulfate sulfotransferase [Phaeodactylibacter sp.]|nr:aryl-sulfate sulfotransferase [Phaeodactylibacter sp.]